MAKPVKNIISGNLQSVKESILDEHKLVTYLSLSKDLSVHVNEAKTLLSQVVKDIKENNSNVELNVSYILSGLFHNNSGRTTVCSDSDLEVQKKSFKSIIFQHIYSVSRGSSGLDNAAFVSLNKLEDFSLCGGLIRSHLCTRRSSAEIGELKTNSQESVHEHKPAIQIKKVTQNGQKDKNVVNNQVTKSEPEIKFEVTSPEKNALTTNRKLIIKSDNKPSKGITGFFTKSNSSPSTNSSKTKDAGQDKDKKSLSVSQNQSQLESKKAMQPKKKNEIIIEIKKEESMDIDEDIPVIVKKEPESQKKMNKKNSSLSQIKKNAKLDKKRKRVLHVSDSDSDDPFADDQPVINESEDEIPPTPSTNTIKITSGILNPKKKRKLIDKIYTDDEGYILTRKEEVYESCSEDDVEIVKTESHLSKVKVEKENVELANKEKVSPTENKSKNSKKKVSPPQKGKQASIMNFFKKV